MPQRLALTAWWTAHTGAMAAKPGRSLAALVDGSSSWCDPDALHCIRRIAVGDYRDQAGDVAGASVAETGTGNLRATVHRGDWFVIVAFAGEIDLLTSPAAHALVEQTMIDLPSPMPDGVAVLVVDLSEIRFFSAKGIHLLTAAVDRARTRRIDLRVVVGANPFVSRVLQIGGLDTALALFPTCTRALYDRCSARTSKRAGW